MVTKVFRPKLRRMNVTFVGTYLPRNCGIATFTYDLSHGVGDEIGRESFNVVALNNVPEGYNYPREVVVEIQQNRVKDYNQAAEYINLSRTDLVCLQHEFGIFGGPLRIAAAFFAAPSSIIIFSSSIF